VKPERTKEIVARKTTTRSAAPALLVLEDVRRF
jgi:hypothetical protein